MYLTGHFKGRNQWDMEVAKAHSLVYHTASSLSKQAIITTILNRLGQCESYDVGLELETALAKAIGEVSTKLTSQIILGDRNEVYHMEWDNLNVLTTSIHGSNVVNSTGGIMIQEIKPGVDVDNMIPKRYLPLYTRSLKLEESHNLLPVYTHTHTHTPPPPHTHTHTHIYIYIYIYI